MIDVTKFVGQVHEVTEQTYTGRTVSISIADGGALPWWDHRPVLALTVEFKDGRRSDVRTADAAAGQLMSKLLTGCTVGMLGGDGWAPKVERQREKGAKNGGTRFTFFVFQGTLDRWPRYAAMRAEDWSLPTVLAQIEADYAAIGRGEDVPVTWNEPAAPVTERARQRQEMHFFK
jgi:hypothetical protein